MILQTHRGLKGTDKQWGGQCSSDWVIAKITSNMGYKTSLNKTNNQTYTCETAFWIFIK